MLLKKLLYVAIGSLLYKLDLLDHDHENLLLLRDWMLLSDGEL